MTLKKMTTTSSATTVLLVHGAWHTPEFYQPLLDRLAEAGYDTACPHLPTCSNEIPPPFGFDDDCRLIRSTATRLADERRRIIALMHSYGGVVGTDCLDGLSVRARSANGQPGGVAHLVFMCSFLLPLNACLATPFGGKLPPFMDEQPEQGTCTMTNPEWRFYDEIPGEAERRRLASRLTWHPASAQKEGGTVRRAAYRSTPTAYIVCENDRALAPEAQKGMIAAAEGEVVAHEAQGGGVALETGGVFGGKVRVLSCQGGHSAFLSMPEEIVRCVALIDVDEGKTT